MLRNYFFSTIAVLSLCVTQNLWCMEYVLDPLGIGPSTLPIEHMDLSRSMDLAGSLDNKLKPVAEVIERGLQRYEDLESEHPKLAKYALKGTFVVGKGLLYATAGGIAGGVMGGSIAGPVGALTGGTMMASEGLIVGMSKGIVDEIRAALVASVAGEPIEILCEKGIDLLAPQFAKLDKTLDEHDARILAVGVIGATLSAQEFKSASKGLTHAAYRGIMRPRALPDKIITAPSKALLDLARTQITRISAGSVVTGSLHLGKEVAPGMALEATLEQRPRQPLHDEFVNELQQQATELLTADNPGSISEGIRASRRIMELEKSPDKETATVEIKKIHEAHRSNPNWELTQAITQDLFTGCSAVLSIAGDHKMARQVAVLGHSGLQLAAGCHMLATTPSLTLSPLAPYTAITTGIASLLSLFGNKDDLSRELVEMYQALSRQISTFHEHMMQRFDRLEEHVDILHVHMVHGFLKLSEQLRDFSAASLYSFERIERQLQELHEINAKVDGLLLSPVVQTCAAIERFPSRFGTLESMEPKEVTDHCTTLENGLLGISPRHEFFNGHVCTDFTPQTVNRVLLSSEPAALLGYLAKYEQSVLGLPLPPDVKPESLPNMGIFTLALERYLALRSQTPVVYDEHCKVAHDIAHAGGQTLTFIESIKTNKALFEKLIFQYKTSYNAVLACLIEALDKTSTELLETVYSHAVKVNQAGIDTFPEYRCLPNARELFAEIRANLRARHYGIKDVLARGLTWLSQNKSKFKIPLTISKDNLLKTYPQQSTTAPLAYIILSSSTPASIPLSIHAPANTIFDKIVSPEALVAERLGLGYPEFGYSFNGSNTFILNARFRKSNGELLNLGTATLTGSNSDPIAASPRAYCESDGACSMLSHDGGHHADGHYTLTISHLTQSCWQNSKLSNWAPIPTSNVTLSNLIDERLTKLRKDALSLLLAPGELGARYKQSLEALQAHYNILNAFCTVAGFGEAEMKSIAKLMDKSALEHHVEPILAGGASEPTNPMLASQETAMAAYSSMLSRTTTADSTGDTFSKPLRILLTKLGQFAVSYPETARLRREELARQVALAQRSIATERETALAREVERMSTQMRSMEALLKQLLGKASEPKP